MASAWGKVLDQASIILSRQDLEKACIKATRHDNSIPKEKHVRRLVVCTHERSDLSDKIYLHLAERLEVPDWIVVMKTLEVFHRLFRDGNPRFLADLKWKGTVFPLGKFNDPTSAEAHAQSGIYYILYILYFKKKNQKKKYAQYLEEKVLVFRALRMEFEKDPTLLKGLSVEESFVRLPKIQRQLDALIHCQTSAEAITNPITALAFEMLLKDSFKLYRGLNDGIITLLESYFTLDKNLAMTALDIYRGFMRETSSIIAMYEMAKKKFTLEVPDLKHAPTTLVNSLEDYIRDIVDNPDGRPSHRGDDRRRSQSPAPSLIDGFASTHAAANPTPSLIDPFGVSDFAQPSQPVQQQAAVFDPFGDSFQPPPTRQPSQFIASPPSSSVSRQPSQSLANNDPFGSTAFPTTFVQPQPHPSYAEKAQQIKAAYTPTLQPTSPTLGSSNQHMQTASPNYPKPNYNISFSTQPNGTQPSGQLVPGGQFNPFLNNTQQPNSFQQPNPYQQPGFQQPGFQQPNAFQQQPNAFHQPNTYQQQQSNNPFF